jgi:kinesin family member 5
MTTLRFGTAARNIKNKPKVNKEYTVEELKKMIAKRDKAIKAYQNRVQVLEEFIKSNNLVVPTDEEFANIALETRTSGFEDIDEAPNSDDDDLDKDSQIFKQTNLLQIGEEDKEELNKLSELQDFKSSELIERIQNLEDLVEREKERYNAQCDQMATLKEDYDIFKDKFSKLESEKEEAENQKNTLTFKLQGFIDKVEEKDEVIKHQEMKLEAKINEVEEFKKANAKLNATLKNFERVNKGKGAVFEEVKEEEVSSQKDEKIAKKFQKEILVLQYKLKLQNEIIKKIKRTEKLSEGSQNLLILNERQLEEIEEKEDKKQSRIKKALLDNEDLSNIPTSDDSFYLSESEVEQLVCNQKMIRQRIEEELAQKRKMREEMEDLKVALQVALQEINPDIQSITTALVEDKVQEMKRSFDTEREHLLSDLANRVQKVCDLELELDLLRDEYRRLENSMT